MQSNTIIEGMSDETKRCSLAYVKTLTEGDRWIHLGRKCQSFDGESPFSSYHTSNSDGRSNQGRASKDDQNEP